MQGVGFRPFVYKLAISLDLTGFVYNSLSSVFVEIQGNKTDEFVKALQNPPPLAKIESISVTEIALKKEASFCIQKSKNKEEMPLVLGDVATCDLCLKELKDKNNKRHNYAFINCTDCGPRYSIIKSMPYDRKNTSMSSFKMCNECHAEYTDPLSRRFHAQPITCCDCAVNLSLIITKKYLKNPTILERATRDPLDTAVSLIKRGKILAIKGIGGFHIVCDAFNKQTVKRLRGAKKRPHKPFALMFENVQKIEKYAHLTEFEKGLLKSKEAPIVLVEKKQDIELIAPDVKYLGVFLAYTPVHHLIFEKFSSVLVATSANLKGGSILYRAQDLETLSFVDAILDNDREIINPSDDSITQEILGQKMLLRLARGYAPLTLQLSSQKTALALGADMKSNIAIQHENTAVIAPFVSDLENTQNMQRFKDTVGNFLRFFKLSPSFALIDAHPNYYSSEFGKANFKTKKVFHHHAHILSVMAEKNITKPVLGVAFDGTGYAKDGSIAGGEFLLCDQKSFKTIAKFAPFRLLGGDVRDIRKIAISILFDVCGFDCAKKINASFKRPFLLKELNLLFFMYETGFNSPFCSSVGRLFDCVAVLSKICEKQTYEGQTGLMIENLVEQKITKSYKFSIENGVINYKKMILQILRQSNKSLIASMFINTLSEIILSVVNSKDLGLDLDLDPSLDLPIVLSGGVFANKTLSQKTIQILKTNGKKTYIPSKVPINDGGISLGQLWAK